MLFAAGPRRRARRRLRSGQLDGGDVNRSPPITLHEVAELTSSVIDATKGMPAWELIPSVAGKVRWAAPFPQSEYALFTSRDVRRTGRYLADVLIPSLHRPAPSWLPRSLGRVFFHQTTVLHQPDQLGSYDSFPAEEWVFINGILTDQVMATWNAAYLAAIFHRPVTIIQNATDGPVSDLIECADEKAFGMNGEPVDVGFPVIHRALKDATKERVVLIAHSQGTLITAVMVRLLRLIYDRRGELMSEAQQTSELAALRASGVTLDPDDFEDVTTEELARLEIYCFANCATEMRYVDTSRELPRMESLGNEHDLVARLGMLAPDQAAEGIAIDGQIWVHNGAWGHLLNAHYLHAIELAQGDSATPGPATATAAPYNQIGGTPRAAPALFSYIGGGGMPSQHRLVT